jgi:hypothetical protein
MQQVATQIGVDLTECSGYRKYIAREAEKQPTNVLKSAPISDAIPLRIRIENVYVT